MTTDNWPSTSITPETFAAGLQAIHAPQAVINQLAPAGGGDSRIPDQLNVLEEFVKAAATPEDRQKFSQAIGCTYDDLTRWAIRADLRRIEGIDAEAAELLASAGVMGVHDLAACTEHPQRLGKLQEDLYQKVNSSTQLDPFKRQALKRRLQRPELVRLGMKGRALPSYVIADVAVILVVKGAGVQRPDETLDVFLDGFWPAVKSVDSRATLSKRQDVFPPGYRSSAYDKEPLNQVTEIRSGERRIWLREPNWDAALVPANPLGALFKEWRMATYAFGRGLHDLFANPDIRQRRRNFWEFYRAFAVIYWLIFWHIGLTFLWGRKNWDLAQGLFEGNTQAFLQLLAAVTVAALVFALLPAVKTNYQMKVYQEGQGRLEALPGVADWVAILLVLAFLLSPGGYVLWLLFVLVLELALLLARAIAWPYREISNSDSLTDHYYSIKDEIDETTGKAIIYKWSNNAPAGWHPVEGRHSRGLQGGPWATIGDRPGWSSMDERTWNDAFAVGVESMDRAHRVQAALVDAIERGVNRGGDPREVQDLLLRLVEETTDHFAAEHDLMRARGFPEREAHVEEHDKLLQHVSALLGSHSAGQPRTTVDLARSLRDWLVRHLEGSDRALGEFLGGSGDR